jgi:regulator of sigma E protease
MELLLSILSSTLWVLLALTILVFVHEFGHFITAKYFGMRVERFSLGFPPTIVGRQYGDTEYVIGATPLGGYVKISGMIDESLDTDHVESEPEPWEFRAKPVWQRIVVISAGVVFNVILALFIFAGINWAEGDIYIPAQNVKQVYVQEGSVAHDIGLRTGDQILRVNGQAFERFDEIAPSSIVAADTLTMTVERDEETKRLVGPPNIITRLSRAQNDDEPSLGAAPLPGLGYLPPLIGGVRKGSPADSLGIQGGDRILTVGKDTVRFWLEMSRLIQQTEGEPVTFRWQRPDSLAADTVGARGEEAIVRWTDAGPIYQATARPMYDEKIDRYLLGVANPMSSPVTQNVLQETFGVQRVRYGPVEAFTTGLTAVWENTRNIVVTLQRVITGRDDLRDSLGGPVMIAKVTSQAAAAGPTAFWQVVAILSVTLAIMNILPIPALDGGQLLFLLYEAVTRRKPSVRVRMVAQQIGMILLLGFMAFIIFNDILRL